MKTNDQTVVLLVKKIIAAVVKDDGTWITQLDTSECDTQLTFSMTVFPVTEDEVMVTITDIRVGEVWVCSGQSNMQFTVSQVRLRRKELSSHLKCFIQE